MRFRSKSIVAVALGVILAAATLAPANAVENDDVVGPNAVGPVVTYREVIDKSSTAGYINYGNRLTYCQAVTAGQTCTISQTFGVTRTIAVSLGMSRYDVAVGLNISSADTRSVTVSCTSPSLAAGKRYEAFPTGTRYTYRIKKYGTMQPVEYSGWLNAFDPNGGIACRVA